MHSRGWRGSAGQEGSPDSWPTPCSLVRPRHKPGKPNGRTFLNLINAEGRLGSGPPLALARSCCSQPSPANLPTFQLLEALPPSLSRTLLILLA